ncbi:hypothetical protein ANN_09261 [Periplaneta americana]|uniref:DUF4817 domain-containing protein n=1 Tax=Periplaneta americana TaxID=6978 RepID=A0ABQ8TND5_PERAM|nr:hypothetical protein ANN_09261 [Periplaneta americana]
MPCPFCYLISSGGNYAIPRLRIDRGAQLCHTAEHRCYSVNRSRYRFSTEERVIIVRSRLRELSYKDTQEEFRRKFHKDSPTRANICVLLNKFNRTGSSKYNEPLFFAESTVTGVTYLAIPAASGGAWNYRYSRAPPYFASIVLSYLVDMFPDVNCENLSSLRTLSRSIMDRGFAERIIGRSFPVERIPNLSAEQSDGITVFRISTMTSLMLHRSQTTTCTAAMIAIETSTSFVPISLQRDVIVVHRTGEIRNTL